MHTTKVPEQVKTQKIQVGVQVSRLKDKDVIYSFRSAMEDFIMLYFVLVRNIRNEESKKKREESDEEIKDEEIEEETKEEEEDDPQYFNTPPMIEEPSYHEWLLKNPRPPSVNAKIKNIKYG
ncbi:hypothetical protein Tco_0303961 [Tanacetum coccineum]